MIPKKKISWQHKGPLLSTVCERVVEAWNTIPAEMVMKSFLKCGISNSLDGSEDDALFDEYVLSTDSPCNQTQDDSVTDNSDDSCLRWESD